MKTSTLMLTSLMITMNASASAQPAGQPSVPTPSAEAQSIPSSTLPDCDYNTCALRLKLSWGNWLILRGEQESRAGKLGMFRVANVESLVATAPEAVAEARVFRKNYMAGQQLPAIGGILVGLGLAASRGDGSAVAPVAGVAGGFALVFYGVLRSNRAMNALHKTIWLYNRSLQR